MSKPFDTATKQLVETYPDAWLQLLGFDPGQPVDIIDADLSTVQAEADKVLRIGGDDPWIAHIEFQTAYDLRLPSRLLRYNAYWTIDIICRYAARLSFSARWLTDRR